jgi:hypothetical protein
MKKSKIGGEKNLRWRKLGRRQVPNFSFLPKVDQFEYLLAKPSKVQCVIFSAIFLTNVGHLQFRETAQDWLISCRENSKKMGEI